MLLTLLFTQRTRQVRGVFRPCHLSFYFMYQKPRGESIAVGRGLFLKLLQKCGRDKVPAMEIRVSNWEDGEVSNSRLVVFKGLILENGSIAAVFDDILVVCGKHTCRWPIYSGHFRAVVELSRNENLVILTYGDTSTELSIIFTPNNTELFVVPLYVICRGHSGQFQAPEEVDSSVESACRRIALGTLLVQCLYAEKLREKGFLKKTFQVENDLDPGSPICGVFYAELDFEEARSLDQETLWERIGRDIMTSALGSDKNKYLAFLSCTYWDGIKVVGDPALGGGGLALLGSATLHTWPTRLADLTSCFTDHRKIPPNLFDNSCFRGTYAGCFSTSLGAVCHEVGHMFNLGHTPTGIMSRGFDNVERVFLSIPSPEVKGRAKSDETNLVLVPLLSVSGSEIVRPKSDRSASQPVEDDLTTFTSACASILAHHRWFNGNTAEKSIVSYDPVRNIVSSDVGLKVVQLRGSCGSVVKSWELGRKSVHKYLILPRLKVSPATLVAINAVGDILTQEI